MPRVTRRPCAAWRLEQTELVSAMHRAGSGVGVELHHEVAKVRLDRPSSDAATPTDLVVTEPFRDEVKDNPLAKRQAAMIDSHSPHPVDLSA